MTKWCGWALALALSAGPALAPTTPVALAQDAAREAEARRHFRLGQAHYENGQFAEAAREFEAAYAASERPRLLYNAYVAYRDLQDTPNAARTLRQFLVESDDIEATEREQLGARLAALEAALAREAEGSDDGEEAREAPAPVPSATSTAAPTPDSTPPPEQDGGFSPSPVGFIVGGVGVALGVGAIITGLLSSGDFATLEDECPGGACPDRQDLRDTRSRGEALAVTTDVLWITGAAALAAGVVLIFVLQEDRAPDAAVAAACAADGCVGVLRGEF